MRYSNHPTEPVDATKQHCLFCFEVLSAHLQGEPLPSPDFGNTNCPLFVTWNVKSSGGSSWRLRGCIGTLEPRQLHTALRDYALTSALSDRRFSPIQFREVPSLKCSVSLLCCFEKAADWQDWTIGTHGLIIEFQDPDGGGRLTATFLPEVCAEQGWTREECIDSLVRKAGYSGRSTAAIRSSLSVVRYQSTKASVTYDEYMAARERESQLPGSPCAAAIKVAA